MYYNNTEITDVYQLTFTRQKITMNKNEFIYIHKQKYRFCPSFKITYIMKLSITVEPKISVHVLVTK